MLSERSTGRGFSRVRPALIASALLIWAVSASATAQATDLHAQETGKWTVCIDPGHPSENNDGRAVVNGISEVSVCWDVANRVKARLEKNPIKVVMTKDSELKYVTNIERAAVANK